MNSLGLARYASLCLLLAFTAPSVTFAQDPARLDEIVTSFVPDRFMGSVLVARGDELVLDKGYGSANLEWNIPNTPDTKFRLGSLTKQFTAAAILLLEERGKLKTSDLLSAHFPDAPEAWKDITIHHLLSHQAGLPELSMLPWFDENITRPFTAAAIIDAFKNLPLDFAPGSDFRYSNSGYIVLGRLVELLGGGSYAAFMRVNIFTPLGMANSGYDSNTQVLAKRASGYRFGPNGPVNAPYLDMSIPHGAGGLYSTTGDLLRWNQGLFGGQLLAADSLAKMLTPNLGDYAYGLGVTTVEGVKKVSHAGSVQGFNTVMTYYPDEKLLVVALSNINGNAPDYIVGHLADFMHGKNVVLLSERREVTVAEDILRQYVGSYPLSPTRVLSITVANGQLLLNSAGQPELQLLAESETRFFVKDVDATIEFHKDASGAVTGLSFNQGGRIRPGPKQALVVAP
jgi:CubicO group peptidase (beta-lactamase class C family)